MSTIIHDQAIYTTNKWTKPMEILMNIMKWNQAIVERGCQMCRSREITIGSEENYCWKWSCCLCVIGQSGRWGLGFGWSRRLGFRFEWSEMIGLAIAWILRFLLLFFLDKVLGVFGSKMLENYWCCKKNGGVPFFKVNFSKVLTYCFK